MFQFVDFAFGNADEDRTSSLRVCFTFSLSPCSRPGPSPQIDAALACRPLTKPLNQLLAYVPTHQHSLSICSVPVCQRTIAELTSVQLTCLNTISSSALYESTHALPGSSLVSKLDVRAMHATSYQPVMPALVECVYK